MAILARKVLKWIFLISIFYILSLIGYDYFRTDSDFIYAIAYHVARAFFGSADGEAMYDAYDYTIISINLISTILVYTLSVSLITIKKSHDKVFKRYAFEVMKGFSFRVLKVVVFILLFTMIVFLVDLTGFDPSVYKYGDDFALPAVIVLTIVVYALIFKSIIKVKSLGMCKKI